MKIAVLDDSEIFLKYFYKQLHSLNFREIHLFSKESEFIDYIKKDNDLDLVFIDFHLKYSTGFDVLEKSEKLLSNTYKIMVTSDSEPSLKEEALKKGFDIFIQKNISKVDLQALLNMIKKLRKYVNKEIRKKEKIKKILNYKDYQEKIIHQKQNKIMKNELEMFFDENFLFETYFKPKDLLTGDTIYTKALPNDNYFIAVIDAMGKGLGASITSFNVLAFLKHSINKAIEYKDFELENLVNNFLNYVKSILLENEILCATLILINEKENKLSYINFGNPPVLMTSKIIKTNNFPITIDTKEFQIDTTDLEDKILISSDGIFESPYNNTIYFKRLKEFFCKIAFLKELIIDFNKLSKQTDDISLVFIRKKFQKFDIILEEKISLDREGIDSFLQKIALLDIQQKNQIHLILYEILLNTYEYAILKVKDKEKKGNNIDYSLKNDNDNRIFFAKIRLSTNGKWIRIDYEDNTSGFDVQTIKDAYYQKYHGRGIKIIKHLSHGLFFNKKGTAVKIFLKVES